MCLIFHVHILLRLFQKNVLKCEHEFYCQFVKCENEKYQCNFQVFTLILWIFNFQHKLGNPYVQLISDLARFFDICDLENHITILKALPAMKWKKEELLMLSNLTSPNLIWSEYLVSDWYQLVWQWSLECPILALVFLFHQCPCLLNQTSKWVFLLM